MSKLFTERVPYKPFEFTDYYNEGWLKQMQAFWLHTEIPMQGDVKKFKVYVRNPATGKTIKVNFGDPNMRIKKSNPKRRKSFRARHNCANPGPRTKVRYGSCRKW